MNLLISFILLLELAILNLNVQKGHTEFGGTFVLYCDVYVAIMKYPLAENKQPSRRVFGAFHIKPSILGGILPS